MGHATKPSRRTVGNQSRVFYEYRPAEQRLQVHPLERQQSMRLFYIDFYKHLPRHRSRNLGEIVLTKPTDCPLICTSFFLSFILDITISFCPRMCWHHFFNKKHHHDGERIIVEASPVISYNTTKSIWKNNKCLKVQRGSILGGNNGCDYIVKGVQDCMGFYGAFSILITKCSATTEEQDRGRIFEHVIWQWCNLSNHII